MLNDTKPCSDCAETSSKLQTYMYIEVAIILGVGVASFCGNTLLIATFYKCRDLRTLSNVLLVNLSAAAILISVIIIPFWAATTYTNEPIFGKIVCRIVAMVASILFINSILTLTGIAVDRFFIICYPFKYQIYGTMNKVLMYISLTWVHSIVMSMPPWLDFGSYDFQPSLLPICMNDYYTQPYYTLLLFLTTFLPAFCLIFLCYFHIFRVARNQQRKVDTFDKSLFTAPPVKATPRRASQASTTSRASSMMLYLRRTFSNNNLWGKASRAVTRSLRQSRAYKTMIAIIGCFIICWTPSVVLLLYTIFYATPKYYAEFTVVILVFLNYILNPLICVTFNKDFRRGVKRCLGLRRKEIVRQAMEAFVSSVPQPKVSRIQVKPRCEISPTPCGSRKSPSGGSSNSDLVSLHPNDLLTLRRGSAKIPIAKAYVD